MTERGTSYGRRLAELAAQRPDEIALTVVALDRSEEHLSWRELDLRSNQVGRVLGERGVRPGERVALEVQNSVGLVLAVLGTWKLGGVPVPMRWDLPDWERSRLLEVVDPVTVVGGDLVAALLSEAAAASAEGLPEVVSPQLNGICSSGSTGLPKVILSERPALWTAAASEPFVGSWRQVPRPQTILVPAPMYHTNGFASLGFLVGGDRLVVLAAFDAELVLDTIERHRVSHFTATPTMLQRIAQVPGVELRDLSSVRWVLQGAAVMPPTLLRTWFGLLSPERIVMAYGMTEQLGLTALDGVEWLDHQGSVGRGFRETEIRILDAEHRDLPVGEIGDVYLRSPMTGAYTYLGGAALLPTTGDGFGTAGDLGWLDQDGYLYVVDRRVDMIVTGGANVYPAEVESALSDHPAIADVVVLGLADHQWGRRVHAVVQLRADGPPTTPGDVIAYAKSRLASYKVPKTVEFAEEIPRSAATKVSRSQMVASRGG